MALSLSGRHGRFAAGRKFTPSMFSRDRSSSATGSRGNHASPRPSRSRNSTVSSRNPAKIRRPRPSVEETQSGDTLEEVGDDDVCKVVMAIDIRERGTVGCSYYVAEQKMLYILEDITLGGMDVVETRKLFGGSISRGCTY